MHTRSQPKIQYMKGVFLFILLVAVISCNTDKKFTITGFTSRLPDSTAIYLRKASASQICDSTMLSGNSFRFQGAVDSIEQYVVHTRDFQDYISLWIDNSEITIDASKYKLRTAKVSGSEFQELNSSYLELENNLKAKKDSIDMIIRITNKSDTVRLESLYRIRDSLQTVKQNAILDFMVSNPEFYLNPYYLTFLMYNQPLQVTEKMFNALSVPSREGHWGKAINTFLNESVELKKGDQAIDFSLPDINGNQVSLNSYRDKYVLLEFWASWCGPCRLENPNLLDAYRKYRDQGFEILGVSLDEQKTDWESAIREDTIGWTTVSDLRGMLGDVPVRYRVNGIPQNYLIDPQGKIIYINLRGQNLEIRLKTIFDY